MEQGSGDYGSSEGVHAGAFLIKAITCIRKNHRSAVVGSAWYIEWLGKITA
jgi:hypothetical protein